MNKTYYRYILAICLMVFVTTLFQIMNLATYKNEIEHEEFLNKIEIIHVEEKDTLKLLDYDLVRDIEGNEYYRVYFKFFDSKNGDITCNIPIDKWNIEANPKGKKFDTIVTRAYIKDLYNTRNSFSELVKVDWEYLEYSDDISNKRIVDNDTNLKEQYINYLYESNLERVSAYIKSGIYVIILAFIAIDVFKLKDIMKNGDASTK